MSEVFLNEVFDESAMFEEVTSEDAMRLWGIDLSKSFETFDEEDVVEDGAVEEKIKPTEKVLFIYSFLFFSCINYLFFFQVGQKRKRKEKNKKKDTKKVKRAFRNQLENTKVEKHKCEMESWKEFNLDEKIVDSLQKLGFSQPTPIQKRCLSVALKTNRSIFGAAQTVGESPLEIITFFFLFSV